MNIFGFLLLAQVACGYVNLPNGTCQMCCGSGAVQACKFVGKECKVPEPDAPAPPREGDGTRPETIKGAPANGAPAEGAAEGKFQIKF